VTRCSSSTCSKSTSRGGSISASLAPVPFVSNGERIGALANAGIDTALVTPIETTFDRAARPFRAPAAPPSSSSPCARQVPALTVSRRPLDRRSASSGGGRVAAISGHGPTERVAPSLRNDVALARDKQLQRISGLRYTFAKRVVWKRASIATVDGADVIPLLSAKCSGERPAVLLPYFSVDRPARGSARPKHRLLKNGKAFIDQTG